MVQEFVYAKLNFIIYLFLHPVMMRTVLHKLFCLAHSHSSVR